MRVKLLTRALGHILSPAPSPWGKDFITERAALSSINKGLCPILLPLCPSYLCHPSCSGTCRSLEQQGGPPASHLWADQVFAAGSASARPSRVMHTPRTLSEDRRDSTVTKRGAPGEPWNVGSQEAGLPDAQQRACLGVSNVTMLIGIEDKGLESESRSAAWI